MTGNAAHSSSEEGAVLAVNLGKYNVGLYREMDKLAEEMKEIRMELRCLGEENQRLKALE